MSPIELLVEIESELYREVMRKDGKGLHLEPLLSKVRDAILDVSGGIARLEKRLSGLRHDPGFHLGFGEIRLTETAQEDLINYFK